MPYDAAFYEKYRQYLREDIVRRNHDHMFDMFQSFVSPSSLNVIDLGCGLGEYAMYDSYHVLYTGIDRTNPNSMTDFIKGDYTTLEFLSQLRFKPNVFISSFSIECCHPADVRYALYERLFAEIPSLQYGMTSGFFYESKRGDEVVREAGDIVSYQTIEDPARYCSDQFTEFRAHIHTPSGMFGFDVIEVWKFFVRK